jgi:type IV secretory pathway VirB10-like protein
MASNARIFFAGIGTSFVILAVGFGAGLILAKSALHDPPLQNRATSEPSPGIRVILPASAEPTPQIAAAPPAPEPKLQAQAGQDSQAQVTQKAPEETATKKLDRDESIERRKRYAERKAKRQAATRIAAAKARQRIERQEPTQPSIMAFGNDEPRISLFGN